MAATKPKRKGELAATEIGDELIVYDPVLDGFHHLNPSAALVFGLCDGTATMRETASDLAKATGQSAAELERHVRRVVRQLRRSELLQPKPTKVQEAALSEAGAAAGTSDERERIRRDVPRSS